MKTVIKKFAIDLRTRLGYGSAFFLLLISYVLTLFANAELLKQAKLVDHSNQIIFHVESMISSLKDAETGMRGYFLMGDEGFLKPYKASWKITDSLYELLVGETADYPDQSASVQTIRSLLDKKFEIMEAGITDFTTAHFTLTDKIKTQAWFASEIMDRTRLTVRKMETTEQKRLSERSGEMTARYHRLNNIIMTSLLLGFVLGIYGFLAYTRENNARRFADGKVAEYQDQLKERIEQLDKANKELIRMRSIEKFASTGRIARTIAHEVRNPLTNINLAADQLRGDHILSNSENAELMLDMINRNSVRINHLITDLLNSTKFSELAPVKVSINTILDETLELAKDRIALHNIWVEKNYSDDICDVHVDVERIKIAFLNIIVNAIEAMEPGHGILQIRTEGRENRCVVTITDNGTGIDKESLSKLFEPYFTNKTKGTGLGLTNTQNIILNHNGHISTESEKGKGTSFTISLDFAK